MQIVCEKCNKKFVIPDEKLPDVPRFGVKCPSCGERIVVERNKEGFSSSPRKQDRIIPKQIEPEMFPPGAKVAFIFLKDVSLADRCEGILREEGYEISRTEDPAEALARLLLNRYDILVLADSKEGRLLLEEIGKWPGRYRREVNVILVGEEAPSLDANIEFLLGINVYISVKDGSRIESLLKEAIARHREYLIPWRYVEEDARGQ